MCIAVHRNMSLILYLTVLSAVTLPNFGCGALPVHRHVRQGRDSDLEIPVEAILMPELETSHLDKELREFTKINQMPVPVGLQDQAVCTSQDSVRSSATTQATHGSFPDTRTSADQWSRQQIQEKNRNPSRDVSVLDPCLPDEESWKESQIWKTKRMETQIADLQKNLSSNRELFLRVESVIAESNRDIEHLKDELKSARFQVQQLELQMHSQHTADLVILDSLSSQLGGLLQRTGDYR